MLARPITLAGKFKPTGLEQQLAQTALAHERVRTHGFAMCHEHTLSHVSAVDRTATVVCFVRVVAVCLVFLVCLSSSCL